MTKPTPRKSAAPSGAPAQKKAPRKSSASSEPETMSETEATRKKKTSVSPAIRKHVAENLKNWMRATPHLDTQVKVSEASGVAQTTVSRILLGSTPATADILDAIAKAFRRDPGDLLTDNSDMKVQYDRTKFSRLPDYEKVRIEAFIKHVLTEYEEPSTPDPKKKSSR
jgi:transcriptional regulator with XRE-family HTH domain